MIFSVQVEVMLHSGISDPQGATIERALPTLGFGGISSVHVGKSIRFQLDSTDEQSARNEVEDMCEKFLTNPVIEQSQITLVAQETVNA